MEFDLRGTWNLYVDEGDWIPCTIPGDSHTALLRANRIPDPYTGTQELAVQYLAQRDFIFERTVEISEAHLRGNRAIIRFDSIDTVAEVQINGKTVAKNTNMFSSVVAEIGDNLRGGINTIRVICYSAEREAQRRADLLPYPVPHSYYPVQSPHRNLVRKVQCHGGWDWGPCLMVAGIYGRCSIILSPIGYIEGISFRTLHTEGSLWNVPVEIRYNLPLEAPGKPVPADSRSVVVHCRVADPTGTTVVERKTEFRDLQGGVNVLKTEFPVQSPRLWWPAGYGEQPLYTLAVELETKGQRLTTQAKTLAFRDLEVVTQEDSIGRSLTFRVNGRDIWAKGANWIPLDSLPGLQTEDRYRQLLEDMVAANMNMVRVWGGGQYENDIFYDLCDQLGLLIWHDMMFSCALYPSNKEFLEEVRSEIQYQVRRLKEHPSIALWCGNNEDVGALTWYPESRAFRDRYIIDYDRLNEGVVGTTIRELDPDRAWWPSSPSAGPADFSDNWHSDGRGDMHYWSVWHEGKPFEAYYDVTPRFCSEFGYQSFPSEEGVRSYCPEDQRNLTSPVMEHHQKNPRGNSIIIENFSRYFRFPEGFTNMLYLSQVQQALAIKTAVDYWRSKRPLCMGALYWQLDDCWPVASWSSIEYSGKWKLLHYAARRFFAPLATVLYKAQGKVQAHVLNDTAHGISGTLHLQLVSFTGAVVWTATETITLGPDSVLAPWTMDLNEIPGEKNKVFLRAELELDEATQKRLNGIDRSLTADLFLVEPKLCEIETPTITTVLKRETDGLELTLSTDVPAFYVSADISGLEGHWDDNMITLLPHQQRTLRFIASRVKRRGTAQKSGPLPEPRGGSSELPPAELSIPSEEALGSALTVQHLRGTYR